MAKESKGPSREEALKVAKYLGCRGVHQTADGAWMPCADADTLRRISTEAETSPAPAEKVASLRESETIDQPKRYRKGKKRRRYLNDQFEQLGERGVLSIDSLSGGGLVSGKGYFYELTFDEHELLDLKEGNYTKPKLRESIKKRIMAGSRGGKPGQWSARKAQLLAIEYRRAGGGYRGAKKKPQRSLDKWTREEWTTSDGKPAIRKGGTTRYLPKKAWSKLTPAQRAATNRKKRRGSRSGQQFIANTERARNAGRSVRNSEKAIIIGRAKPRRGDPDVYDDPNSARLRSRSLGCIGIARRETPDGDIVWTPCTNVSDYRRRTGRSVLSQRDDLRRFQRLVRLNERQSRSNRRTGRRFRGSKTASFVEEKALRRLTDFGSSYIKPVKRVAGYITRRGKCRNVTLIDRDRDGKICNPMTGEDTLPVSPALREDLDPKTREKYQRQWDDVEADLRDPSRWEKRLAEWDWDGDTGDRVLDDLLKAAERRGFAIKQDKKGKNLKVEAPPKFKKLFLMREALGKSNVGAKPIESPHIFSSDYKHGTNKNVYNRFAEQMLMMYGWDPFNDVIYDFYDDAPETWEQIRNNAEVWAPNAYDETKPGRYITDAPDYIARKRIVQEKNETQQAYEARLREYLGSALDRAEKRRAKRDLRDWRARMDEIVELGSEKYGDLDPDRELDLNDEEFIDELFDGIERLDMNHLELATYFNTTPDRMKDAFDTLGIPTERGGKEIRGELLEFYDNEVAKDRLVNVPDWYLMRFHKPKLRADKARQRAERAARLEEIERSVFNPVPGIMIGKGTQGLIDIDEAVTYNKFMSENIDNPAALINAMERNERFAAMVAMRDWTTYARLTGGNNEGLRYPHLEQSHDQRVATILSRIINQLKRNEEPTDAAALNISTADLRRLIAIIANSESHASMLNSLKASGLLKAWVRGKVLGIFPAATNGARRAFPNGVEGLVTTGKSAYVDTDMKVARLSRGKSLDENQTRTTSRQVSRSRSRLTPVNEIRLSPEIENLLEAKTKEHNKRAQRDARSRWSVSDAEKIKSVYRRGLSCYPGEAKTSLSRDEWATARVNAFFKMLYSGAPDNSQYSSDNDLLNSLHPWALRSVRVKSANSLPDLKYLSVPPEVVLTPTNYTLSSHIVIIENLSSKGFFSSLGRMARAAKRRVGEAVRNVPFIRGARDGDGDGEVQDGTNQARKVTSESAESLATLMKRLKDPNGGFTYSMSSLSDEKSGWAIARKGQGIKVSRDIIFNEDGEVTEEGIDYLQAFLAYQRNAFSEKPTEAKRVALGAWHDPSDGMVYFDVTDIHSKNAVNLEQAKEEAIRQNQISFVDLDELTAGNENGDADSRDIFHEGGGDGSNLISDENFQPFLEDMRQQRDKATSDLKIARPEGTRVEIAEDNTAMMIAEPDAELSAKHGIQKDWSKVRALPKQERARIADLYDESDDLPAEEIQQEVREAYEALVKEVEEQFEMLINELRVKVEFVDEDPYENYFEMLQDFRENRRLKIMRTASTGSHPFMTDEQNDKFRAVHDAFGHLAVGRGFDRHGEEAAYQAHKSMFSEVAAKAAATELRGQNSFLIEKGFFGPQKLVILPEEMRKRLIALLGYKQGKRSLDRDAQTSSDNDNAYTSTGSHHVSCGRVLKGLTK